MPIPTTVLSTDCFKISPWPDEVIDRLGHDPRSAYVELFWLSTLGPSTTWLLRRIAAGFDDSPDGFKLDVAETARSLGLGDKNGKSSPFMRAFHRLVQFGLAQTLGSTELAVRRRVPPLTQRQVAKLPLTLQPIHERWSNTPPVVDDTKERAKGIAMSLVRLGESIEETERLLLRWHFHPALAHYAAMWAISRSSSN